MDEQTLAAAAPVLYDFVARVARLIKDGEETPEHPDGFDMPSDDAVDTIASLVNEARDLLAEYNDLPDRPSILDKLRPAGVSELARCVVEAEEQTGGLTETQYRMDTGRELTEDALALARTIRQLSDVEGTVSITDGIATLADGTQIVLK